MIFLTGSSGFVGSSIIKYFKCDFIKVFSRNKEYNFEDSEIIIHLAGKAHDLKNTSSPEEYYYVNTELTKKIYDSFLASEAKVFITLSSVKAVADEVIGNLSEEHIPIPATHYGKSKLLAEQYILSKEIPQGKRVYILRPCMIHGPGNKGNLNLLFKIVAKGLPWPLGSFDNHRSFCSIDNLCFVIKELIDNDNIPSGVYNVADDEPLSTNMIIELISNTLSKKSKIWKIPKLFIEIIATFGSVFNLPLNTERLNKLTQSYIVCNSKIILAMNKSLPLSSKDGMIKTLDSFLHL